MQLDLFLRNIISTSLLDGLALGLGGAFLLTTLFGIFLARRRRSYFAWSIEGILSIVVATASGFVVYLFIGLVTTWAGSAIHGLSGSDLSSWSDLTSIAFSIYQEVAVVSSYWGSIAGLAMGYGLGIRPRDEATTFGVIWAVLAIFILLAGFSFILLQMLIVEHSDMLYYFAGLSTAALAVFALYKIWRSTPEGMDEYATQDASAIE